MKVKGVIKMGAKIQSAVEEEPVLAPGEVCKTCTTSRGCPMKSGKPTSCTMKNKYQAFRL